MFGVTSVHPLALLFMICMIALALMSRRSAALLALILVCVFMPMQQRIVIVGLDFPMLRLIMVVAWVRVLVKGEFRGLNLGKLDYLVLLWICLETLVYLLRVGPSGLVFRLGVTLDTLSSFFLVRVLVRSPNDVLVTWRYLAWTVLVMSPLMLLEAIAQYNVFGIFHYTGVDTVVIRDGEARAQGPWSHPILAGTFGSVVVPVFIAIYRGRRRGRILFALAILGATMICLVSGSSGPVIAWGVGVFGWGIWRFRKHMRLILGAMVCLAVVIHFAREKPIWHLMLRLSEYMGGTGYHRNALIDAFVNRFGEWALVGTDTTAHWGRGLQDVTGHYIAIGVNGGLVSLILFLLVLRTCFVQLRFSREVFERRAGARSLWALLAWGSSVSLAVHCVSFVSVSYFGQLYQLFFFFIGTVPAFARPSSQRQIKTATTVPSPRATKEHPKFATG